MDVWVNVMVKTIACGVYVSDDIVFDQTSSLNVLHLWHDSLLQRKYFKNNTVWRIGEAVGKKKKKKKGKIFCHIWTVIAKYLHAMSLSHYLSLYHAPYFDWLSTCNIYICKQVPFNCFRDAENVSNFFGSRLPCHGFCFCCFVFICLFVFAFAYFVLFGCTSVFLVNL